MKRGYEIVAIMHVHNAPFIIDIGYEGVVGGEGHRPPL